MQSIGHSTVVHTGNGYIQGFSEMPDLAVYLGIPYAAPPVDSLRWRSPVPPRHWADTLLATAYGPSCPQLSKDNEPTSEDCLYLNVFTSIHAKKTAGQKMPVMLWIHGGGFLGGSAKGYDGRILAKKGVVVVTINYRVGPFGYLYHPALLTSPANKGVGNYGLLDQIAALKWVSQNIAAFGGDPGNITIWGESAGAFSVGALLATPLAKGLFHKAILESGTGLINGIQSKAAAAQYAITRAELVGIKGNSDTAYKALYALPAEQLVQMHTRPDRPQLQGFYVWFSPVVDGEIVPLPLDKAINGNKWNNVSLLLGTNLHEGAYFQREKPTDDTAEYYRLLGKESMGDTTGILKAFYLVHDTGEILTRSQEVVGDFAFAAPARALARLATAKNGKVFLYHFTRLPKDNLGNEMKALHSTELPFVFGYTPDNWVPYKIYNGKNAADVFLADAVSTYWTNFAKYGTPNGPAGVNQKLPSWPVYELKNNSYLQIGEQIKPGTNLKKRQMDAADQLAKQKGEVRF
ncbi:MAG: carboxylesterase family protein [Chitinophagaceae bacterium]